MTDDIEALKARLRERAAAREFGADPFSKETFVEWQAADTISRLTADNEALRKERQTLIDAANLAGKIGLDHSARADALAQEVAEAKRLLANSLKEYAPISSASHRSEVQDFLARAALREKDDA